MNGFRLEKAAMTDAMELYSDRYSDSSLRGGVVLKRLNAKRPMKKPVVSPATKANASPVIGDPETCA